MNANDNKYTKTQKLIDIKYLSKSIPDIVTLKQSNTHHFNFYPLFNPNEKKK